MVHFKQTYRPHISGAMGEGQVHEHRDWRGLHTGWGYNPEKEQSGLVSAQLGGTVVGPALTSFQPEPTVGGVPRWCMYAWGPECDPNTQDIMSAQKGGSIYPSKGNIFDRLKGLKKGGMVGKKKKGKKPKKKCPLRGMSNGGTGTGQPVLVHAGEIVIKNPYGRRRIPQP